MALGSEPNCGQLRSEAGHAELAVRQRPSLRPASGTFEVSRSFSRHIASLPFGGVSVSAGVEFFPRP